MNKLKKQKRVVVGMSGGVDSSVVASLLKQQGYDVIGVFMQFWFPSGETYGENRCCSLESWHEAKKVADIIGIPIYKLNFGKEFKRAIVDDFLKDYKNGLTPNPCVACNKFIKFDLLWRKAKAIFKADYLATGHYVRLGRKISNPKSQIPNKLKIQNPKSKVVYKLLRSEDKTKDQTYFLYNLKQKDLAHLLFPLGKYRKTEVRQIAQDLNLPVHNKKDSQEICFVGHSHYDFLKKYLKLKPGIIITHDSSEGRTNSKKSRELGRHFGLPLYTIGQREGLNLSSGPWYVSGLNYRKNILIVTKNQADSKIFQNELRVGDINWLSGKSKFPIKCLAQIRYHAKPASCVVEKKGKILLVKFKEKQRAIMPGQSVVFYKREELLGGGVISQ